MLILDTTAIDADDRPDRYQSAVSTNCTTSAATFEDPANVWATIHAFDLGETKILTIDASGTTLRRTPKMARAMNDCPIALALPLRSANRFAWSREERVFDREDLMLVDLSAPYVYSWAGDGASYAYHVDYDRLDVPMDTIRRAMPRLRSSPLYTLVRDHIARVMLTAQEIIDSGTASDVGLASVALMRALIVSAAGDAHPTHDAIHHSLRERIDAYIVRHLREHDLTPAKIAAANAISVRQLYRLYEGRPLGLEATIIDRRLSEAHAALGQSGSAPSIAAVAASYGFSSPSFFADRFKTRYGLSPRQWRAQAGASREIG